MVLHQTAATTSPNCNRLFLRKKVVRSTPVTNDEISARSRFTAVTQAVALRRKDLSKISQDQIDFLAQKDLPSGKKTLKAWYWMVEGAAYDQEHPRS